MHPRVLTSNWPDVPIGLAEPLVADRERATPVGILQQLVQQHGDFVHYRTHFGSFYLVNQPSLVREVANSPHLVRNRLLRSVLGDGVLTTDGEHWEQERRVMLPAFGPGQVRSMVDAFQQVAEVQSATWLRPTGSDSDRDIDISRDLFRIALANIGRVLFSTEFEDGFLDAVECIIRDLAEVQNASIFGFSLIRRPSDRQRFLRAQSVMNAVAAELVEALQTAAPRRATLLEILGSHLMQNDAIDVQLIRDEILTIVTAGHETTAVTLCWALRCIASHPEVAAKLAREVDEVLGTRAVQAEDLPRLTYTRMVIDETMRMYPAIWIIARTAIQDVELGGRHIPSGSGVLVSPFMVHRHADHWPDPETFVPERFAPTEPTPAPGSYIPFFAGRHLCLGKHFALVELVVVLATLAQRFSFRLRQRGAPEFEPLASLRIRGGLHLEVVPRRPGVAT